jgi:hypothetical protein
VIAALLSLLEDDDPEVRRSVCRLCQIEDRNAPSLLPYLKSAVDRPTKYPETGITMGKLELVVAAKTIRETGRRFINLLAKGHITQAYELTTPAMRKSGRLESIQAQVARYWENLFEVNSDSPTVLRISLMGTLHLSLFFVKEDTSWKIDRVTIP